MTGEQLVLLIVWLLAVAWQFWGGPRQRCEKDKDKTPRPLRPRTPKSCAACQAEEAPSAEEPRQVRPWREVKGRRGRKKTVDTEGHACWVQDCEYHGITDSEIHALVGNGHHGQNERIQDFKCQACQSKVSERRDTPLYGLKTPSARVSEVLAALAEGLDVAAAVRVFGHAEETIVRWRTRAGMHAERMHQRFFHHLNLGHIQFDELKTRLRQKGHEVWLWVALDAKTKIIPSLALGRRTQELANTLVHALCQVLAPGCPPVFTSDGLNMYFYALTAHFGHWRQEEGQRKPHWVVAAGLLYGQVKKYYRRRHVARVAYLMRSGELAQLKERLKALGLSGRLNTAFVERLNLTLRQSIAFLIRRTWGTAQTVVALMEHLQWWRGYYHFVRPHHALRVELGQPIPRKGRQLPQRYRSRTPAMAAGVTHHRWTAQEFLSFPLPAG